MWWSCIPIFADWLLKTCLSVCYVVGVCEPICANWLLEITPLRAFCSLCMEVLLPELSISGGRSLIFFRVCFILSLISIIYSIFDLSQISKWSSDSVDLARTELNVTLSCLEDIYRMEPSDQSERVRSVLSINDNIESINIRLK